ncbi:MAG: hypothetical protein GY940_31420 [bacterium]|nr:hypothetical protein [bacterium]
MIKPKEIFQAIKSFQKGRPKSKPRYEKQKEYFFNEFYVAGYAYYEGELVEDSLLEGKAVRFERQPDCSYDHRAVEVYAAGKKLGYIPRKDNQMIAALLDNGFVIKGEIRKRNFDDRPNQRVKIAAYKEKS